VMPPDKDLRSRWNSTVDKAYAGHPRASSAAYQASLAIYAKLSADNGDETGVIDPARWDKAIQLATGGTGKWNSKQIVLPYGYTQGQFQDGLAKRIDQLLATHSFGEGVTRQRLLDMPLEPIGDGRYMFISGDGALAARPKGDKPQIRNADGSVSTEQTITIESDGKHLILPTIVGGKRLTDAEAVKQWRAGKNEAVGTFDTAEAADSAARARTASLSRELALRPVVIDFNTTTPYIPSGAGIAATTEQPTEAERLEASKPVTGKAKAKKKP
jgi:hypothetical protein